LLRVLLSEKLARPNRGSSRAGGPSWRVVARRLASKAAHVMLKTA